MRAALALLALLAFAPARAADEASSFRDCKLCPEMVRLPAGEFVMGSDTGDESERPAHRVRIAKPFAIGKFEVSFEEWETCATLGGCARKPDDHKWGRGRQPVMNIAWAEMQAYAAWLSSITKKRYRLPSEAEWEYAARGGATTEFWWGDKPGEGHANCRNCGTPWSGDRTAPIGSLPANPFGLHDTAGNLWEWTQDCWSPDHTGAPQDGSARGGGTPPDKCPLRVMKGGAWYYYPAMSRPATRAKQDVRIWSYTVGFRLVRELD
jgi:formylglycine-generating enzyme required for sulfatase activity